MSRLAWVIFFLSSEVLAHPGHGAPDSHFHESPAILLLAAAVLAAAIWRLIPALAEIARRTRQAKRSEIAAPRFLPPRRLPAKHAAFGVDQPWH